MSARSVVAHQWKPIAVGAVFMAAEGFAINKVSAENPKWWWWIVVLAALLGVVGSAVWGVLAERANSRPRPTSAEVSQGDVAVAQEGGSSSGATQQSVVGEGQNVNIKADNNSVAAYKIKNLSWGTPPSPPDDEELDRR